MHQQSRDRRFPLKVLCFGVWLLSLAYRSIFALITRTSFVPDEYFQCMEVAYAVIYHKQIRYFYVSHYDVYEIIWHENWCNLYCLTKDLGMDASLSNTQPFWIASIHIWIQLRKHLGKIIIVSPWSHISQRPCQCFIGSSWSLYHSNYSEMRSRLHRGGGWCCLIHMREVIYII